jgi:CRISPR-associated exonuclease Cas4
MQSLIGAGQGNGKDFFITEVVLALMPPMVRVSDLGLYLRCPRLVYFDGIESLPRRMDASHILLRSLALSISKNADLEAILQASLQQLAQELHLIYDIDPGELALACRQLDGSIADIAEAYRPFLDILLPCEVEVDLRSPKLGLSGRLDRLIREDLPSIIRTGSAPAEGAWKRDRLQLAGYALILGEKRGRKIDSGLVEYPRSGVVREVEIRGVDRARALRIRDRIRQIKEGALPDRPAEANCELCPAVERCSIRSSLASKFF